MSFSADLQWAGTLYLNWDLKELYTSDTTLSQMIDWTPPSNELWGKIRSDPPPPWKSWKKLLSVRILHGPVRNLHGPVRHLHGPVRNLYGPGPCRWRRGPYKFSPKNHFLSNYENKSMGSIFRTNLFEYRHHVMLIHGTPLPGFLRKKIFIKGFVRKILTINKCPIYPCKVVNRSPPPPPGKIPPPTPLWYTRR